VVLETLYYVILVPMVYLAFGVFLVGTSIRLVKIFRSPANPSTLQVFPEKKPAWLHALVDTFLFPTVRRHKPVLWIFLMAFHIGIFLLILGHLELFGEIALLQLVPHEIFLGGGFVGLILSICLLYFLFRRFHSPVKELSVPEDYFLLILLLLTVLFGSEMDWARNWYYYDGLVVEDYREYLYSMLIFQPVVPETVVDSGHSFMLVLHIFCANLFIMSFPFTHLMHSFLSLPVNKLRRG
jgi:nitrate reductase gamma subunit